MINTLLKYIGKAAGKTGKGYLSKLEGLAKEFEEVKLPDNKRLKILYGPSFSVYPPSYVHDSLFSYALRLRGAEIVPIYCDAIQSVECNYFGGVWGGGNFEENCRGCCSTSERLWSNLGLMPLRFSNYIEKLEVQKINEEIDSLKVNEWTGYQADGLTYGGWAKDILVNNWVVGDYRRIKDHERLGRAHLKNLLILGKVYSRILEEAQPDRVVANDSFYGMWAILQKLCEQRKVPFYSHWSGTRQNSWCYAYNDASMNLNFSKAWKKYSVISLDDRRRQKAAKWLEGRLEGKEMILNTASLADHQIDEFDLSGLDAKKPIALLAANVIWDLAALNKQIVFKGMMEWIIETIEWFREYPAYQLIIKAHPAEQNPSIPETEERVEVILKQRGIALPENVFFLSPKAKLSVYQLFPITKVGIVYTTTTGIEMAAHEIPVITAGKAPFRGYGFTVDPATKEEYYNAIERIFQGVNLIDKETQVDLTNKFILFYNYHYYTKIDFMDYRWGERPILKVNSIKELSSGQNRHLDYIVDCIIDGFPIVSEDRWPAES